MLKLQGKEYIANNKIRDCKVIPKEQVYTMNGVPELVKNDVANISTNEKVIKYLNYT